MQMEGYTPYLAWKAYIPSMFVLIYTAYLGSGHTLGHLYGYGIPGTANTPCGTLDMFSNYKYPGMCGTGLMHE